MTETQQMYDAIALYELPCYVGAETYRIAPPDDSIELKCWQYLAFFGSMAILCDECRAKKARGEPLPARCSNIVAIDLRIKY